MTADHALATVQQAAQTHYLDGPSIRLCRPVSAFAWSHVTTPDRPNVRDDMTESSADVRAGRYALCLPGQPHVGLDVPVIEFVDECGLRPLGGRGREGATGGENIAYFLLTSNGVGVVVCVVIYFNA